MTSGSQPGAVVCGGLGLGEVLRRIGVERGDCLLVHSDITSLLEANLTVPSIIGQLLDALGNEGTLVLPTFNFGWCDGAGFDHRRTPSQMGLLTEWARRDPRFVRTAHPVYSFAVAGRRQADFMVYDQPNAYGVGSGFDIVHNLDGKILAMGLPWSQSMTFFHYIEEQERVPYRYFKPFAGRYRDTVGKLTKREYFLYVRNLETGVETYLEDAERHFLENGFAKETQSLGTRFILVGAKELYEESAKELRLNPQFLHRINTADLAKPMG